MSEPRDPPLWKDGPTDVVLDAMGVSFDEFLALPVADVTRRLGAAPLPPSEKLIGAVLLRAVGELHDATKDLVDSSRTMEDKARTQIRVAWLTLAVAVISLVVAVIAVLS
jgi:hypothetical protein